LLAKAAVGQIKTGALLAGGEGRPDGLDGWFVRPTLFTNVRNDMTIAREEIFGPVLSIIPKTKKRSPLPTTRSMACKCMSCPATWLVRDGWPTGLLPVAC
jgi:hypothetical protein